MRRGTLSEQYFQRTSPDGKETVRLGPYYKFQIWQDRGNHTRSVSAGEASELREDIANYHLYKQLTAQLADLTIEQTIALRVSEASAPEVAEKKTSKRNASPKDTAKRNSSSTKRAGNSSKKRNTKT